MVVNEVTSTIQTKGTKTVLAAAVVTALMGSQAALATLPEWQSAPTSQGETQFVYTISDASTGSYSTGDLASGKTLWVEGKGDDSRATGLWSPSDGVTNGVTNSGTIYVSGKKSWKNHGIGGFGTVTNAGTIYANSAYGMYVGQGDSTKTATLTNSGTIYVTTEGVGIELGGEGQNGGTHASATNSGTIELGTKTGGFLLGVLVKGVNNQTFTNTGSINAEGQTAISVEVADGTQITNQGTITGNIVVADTATDTTITLENGIDGDITGDATVKVTGDVINTAPHHIALVKGDAEAGKLEVAQRATLTNQGLLKAKEAVIDGTLNTSVSAGFYSLRHTTVNDGGVLNFDKLNSRVDKQAITEDLPGDRLLVAGAPGNPFVIDLNGGKLQVAGQDYTGKVKLGGSNTGKKKFGGAILNTAGNYSNEEVELANTESQLNVKSGSYSAGKITNVGTVSVAGGATLNLGGGSNAGRILGQGTLNVTGDFTNAGALTLAKSATEPAGTITVAEGKTLTNTGVLAADQAQLDGTLTTSISEGHFLVRETTVNTSGALNFTEYNSKSTGDTNDQLLIAGKKAQGDQTAIPAVVNLKGGQLQVANATVKKVKLGGSDTGSFGAAILNTEGTYAMDRVELANSASQLNVKSGSFTAGELVVKAGTVTTAQDAILTVNGGENHATIAGLGTVAIEGDFTNAGALTLAKSATEPAGTITVAQDKTLTNEGVLAADQAQLDGTLTTSISEGHFLVRETTVNTSGALNFTEYNSKSTGDTNDQLLIAGKKAQGDQTAIPAVVNLKGGQLQVANATVKKVKLGGSDTGSFGAAILNTEGTYAMDRVELANSASQLNVKSGSFSAGELLVNAGTVTTAADTTLTLGNGQNQGAVKGEGTVKVTGDFTNAGLLQAKDVVIDGQLTTKVSATSYGAQSTTVNAKGVLNLTELNSRTSGNVADPADQLFLAGPNGTNWVLNLNGGKVQINGEDFAGNLKLGGSSKGTKGFGGGIVNITQGSYTANLINLYHPNSQVNITGGDLTVSTLSLHAGQTQVSGGTLTVSTITPGSGTLVLNGGNLVSQIGQLYLDGSNNATLASTQITKKGFLTLTGGTLTLLDAGEYSTATLAALQHSFETGKIVLQNAKLHVEEDKPASMIDNVVLPQQEVVATGTAVDTTEPIKATEEVVGVKVNNNGGASLIVAPTQEDKTPVAVVLQAPTNSNGAKTTVTLAGSTDGKALVANTDNTPLKVTVSQGVELNLGIETSTQETKGELPALVVTDGAVVNVTKMVAKVEQVELAQGAAMNVGSDGARAVLAVEDLKVAAGATLFLDPEWTNDPSQDTVENATIVTADSATIDGNVVVGRNSLAVIGMTQDDGIATLKKFSELAWGPEGTTAAAVLGTPVTIGDAGALTIDGSLEAPTSGTGVTIAANSALVIDASQGSETTPYVTGALTNNGGTIAVANATIGKFMLADTVTNSGTLITDNPLVEATVEDNMLVESVNNAGFSQMVSSMGVQSMMRRADMVFTQTIGDRVALNQKLDKGLNLWVDVTGEKYKADGFDYKGEFSSNMGYGAFGADMALTEKVSAGVAVQYGKGKLDSDKLGIENDVQNYGLGLYGTFAVADNAQIVGELSYLTGKNDIEMTMSTFNQKLDANILSAGVTGQMQFDLGNFVLVPSVGVRVSRLHTDAMQFAGVHVESQNQTLVQLPLTLRFSGKLMESAGWSFAPTAKIAFVPTFGDKQFEALGTETTVIDTTPVQADLGVVARKGNLFFNAALQLGAGQEGSSSVGGKVGVKYVF